MKHYEFWFVVGSQTLYGDDVLTTVANRAEEMARVLRALPLPEPDHAVVLDRMARQLRNAREWRDVLNTFFHRLSGAPDTHGRKIYD